MDINFCGAEDGEPEAVAKAYQRAVMWSEGFNADIFIHPRCGAGMRDPEGWLEYHIVLKRQSTGYHYMTIGMVQRSPGAEFEFHS